VTNASGTHSVPFLVTGFVEHVDFNVESSTMPLLGESWFRQAVARAIDRNAIITDGNGGINPQQLYAPQHSLVHLSHEPAYQSHFDTYAYDPDAVETIMLDHDCVKGADDIWECGGVRASIKLATTAGSGRRERIQDLIQASALAAGIEILDDNSPTNVLFGTRLPAQDYELIFFGWLLGGESGAPADRYGCTGVQNNTGYCSTEVTTKLDAAATAPTTAQRNTLWNEADALLATDMVSLPLARFRNPNP
jgi:ABC-type transport system substrate-binding protein